MVGRWSFPFGKTYFQGRPVSSRECITYPTYLAPRIASAVAPAPHHFLAQVVVNSYPWIQEFLGENEEVSRVSSSTLAIRTKRLLLMHKFRSRVPCAQTGVPFLPFAAPVSYKIQLPFWGLWGWLFFKLFFLRRKKTYQNIKNWMGPYQQTPK